jgi:glycosyl transferase family 25
MPIFVVNLRRDPEKKAHMEKIARTLGLNFDFVDAVYGADLTQLQIDEVYDENLSLKFFKRGLSHGELGCALSHLSIYKKMVNEGIEATLILEDDVDISDDIHNIIKSTRKFPKNWELMLCGYYAETITERISASSLWGKSEVTPLHQSVRLVEVSYGTHGYIINNRGAKKLLSELNMISKPIDHYTCSENHLNMYALSPRVVSLNPILKEMSHIETERAKKSNKKKINSKTILAIQSIWRLIKKIKFIAWLTIIPKRLFILKKYN